MICFEAPSSRCVRQSTTVSALLYYIFRSVSSQLDQDSMWSKWCSTKVFVSISFVIGFLTGRCSQYQNELCSIAKEIYVAFAAEFFRMNFKKFFAFSSTSPVGSNISLVLTYFYYMFLLTLRENITINSRFKRELIE